MKKYMLLCSLALLLLITSCQSNKENNIEPVDVETSTSGIDFELSNTLNEKKNLSLWVIETGKRLELWEAVLEKFEQENPDVEVELVQFPNDPYKQKLTMAMGKSNQPDVFHTWGGGWLKDFVNANHVMELTNDLDMSVFVPSALANASFNDRIYGVPIAITIVPVFYNKEIFEKFQITIPTTFDELLSVIDTLNEEKIIPFALANKTKWPGALIYMYLASRIADHHLFINAYERNGAGYNDNAYVEAGELIQQLVKRGAFNSDFNKLPFDTGQSRQLMYSGKAAMEIQTNAYINFIRNEAPEFEEKLGIFPFPVINGGDGKMTDLIGGVSPVLSISANTKYPKEAIALVEALTSIELAEQLSNETGAISAINGVRYSDPFAQQFHEMLLNATYVQSYYDQVLPASLAELHKDTTQGLFGLSITPVEAAQQMEEMAQKILQQ